MIWFRIAFGAGGTGHMAVTDDGTLHGYFDDAGERMLKHSGVRCIENEVATPVWADRPSKLGIVEDILQDESKVPDPKNPPPELLPVDPVIDVEVIP